MSDSAAHPSDALETELAGAMDPAVPAAPSPEPERVFTPITREQIDSHTREIQWQTELSVVLANLKQAHGDLAVAKVAERLSAAGGIGHPGEHQKIAKQSAQRIRILKEAWLELQNQEPLPAPSDLQIVSGFVVPE